MHVVKTSRNEQNKTIYECTDLLSPWVQRMLALKWEAVHTSGKSPDPEERWHCGGYHSTSQCRSSSLEKQNRNNLYLTELWKKEKRKSTDDPYRYLYILFFKDVKLDCLLVLFSLLKSNVNSTCDDKGSWNNYSQRKIGFDFLAWQGIFLPESTFSACSVTVFVQPLCGT